MIRGCIAGLLFVVCGLGSAIAAGPDCSRTFTLALHDHGLLYSADTDTGIDKDFADELMRRSGCKISVSLMSRDRIWQLIESGALDFSLSGIANEERKRFASFAWYFSNKYYLLVRKDAGMNQLTDVERSDIIAETAAVPCACCGEQALHAAQHLLIACHALFDTPDAVVQREIELG